MLRPLLFRNQRKTQDRWSRYTTVKYYIPIQKWPHSRALQPHGMKIPLRHNYITIVTCHRRWQLIVDWRRIRDFLAAICTLTSCTSYLARFFVSLFSLSVLIFWHVSSSSQTRRSSNCIWEDALRLFMLLSDGILLYCSHNCTKASTVDTDSDFHQVFILFCPTTPHLALFIIRNQPINLFRFLHVRPFPAKGHLFLILDQLFAHDLSPLNSCFTTRRFFTTFFGILCLICVLHN